MQVINANVSAPPKPKQTASLELITPEIATKYLGRNFERNRNLKKTWVFRLEKTMRDGEFYTTHQGIAFDEEGNLVDGQNRLQAIANSGVSVWVWVIRGINHKAVRAFDRGLNRTITDQIRITTNLEIKQDHIAVARAMLAGSNTSLVNSASCDHDVMAICEAHWEPIEFVAKHRRKNCPAFVRGVVARAYYYIEKDILERFLHVLANGIPADPTESAAVRLKAWLSNPKSNIGTFRSSGILRTISALDAFSEKRPLAHLYEASSDPWPLPE
jgi:hypothetical protein